MKGKKNTTKLKDFSQGGKGMLNKFIITVGGERRSFSTTLNWFYPSSCAFQRQKQGRAPGTEIYKIM